MEQGALRAGGELLWPSFASSHKQEYGQTSVEFRLVRFGTTNPCLLTHSHT